MSDSPAWQSVRQAQPSKDLQALVGDLNSFAQWPDEYREEAFDSFAVAVDRGQMPQGYDVIGIVGRVTRLRGVLELRAAWTPPAAT